MAGAPCIANFSSGEIIIKTKRLLIDSAKLVFNI